MENSDLFHLAAKVVCCAIVLPAIFCQAGQDVPSPSFGSGHASGDQAKLVPERKDIETKYLWATEGIFPSVKEWEKEYKEIEIEIEKVATLKGTLGKGAGYLLRALQMRDELEPRLTRVYVYTNLLKDQDTRVDRNQALFGRARTLFVNYSQKLAWIEPEMTAVPYETIESWMDEEPELRLYKHYFDNLYRQKKHILSEREEELLAMAGQVRSVPYTAYSNLANADLTFPKIRDEHGKEVELDDSAFYLYMRSNDRKVRKAAYEAIVSTYKNYRNTTAALLNGVVQSHILTVKARGYDSCLQAALHGGNIPVEVYDTLVETVNDNLPILHRYQTLRKRVLRLEDGVHAYDLFAPLSTSMTPPSYEYEDAVALIEEALEPLGPEYIAAMKKGFRSRWVDVFPTKGKRSGAYSSGTFLTQPYILMNYHGGYEDVSTLAHEMGHSMHSYFSRGTQPYIYADYDIFCAEVASTCNEILLINHVLDRTDDPKVQLYLITEFLENFRGTVFRQTMFSEFEQKIHELAEQGVPLTAGKLGEVYGEIMKKYYGPDYTHDELVDNYWIRIPHFYYNFYVYKYSTSFCAAANIAGRIMDGEKGAVEAYMQFLKGGSRKYPVEMLELARVDMKDPKTFEDCMKLFEKMLSKAEALLDEVQKNDSLH